MLPGQSTTSRPTARPTCPADDALIRRWRDRHDIQAADLLARRYRHLVVRLSGCSEGLTPPDDLLGAAQVGLMRAICRFDPDGRGDFTSFANKWISASLLAYRLSQRADAAKAFPAVPSGAIQPASAIDDHSHQSPPTPNRRQQWIVDGIGAQTHRRGERYLSVGRSRALRREASELHSGGRQ